jgi:hypothetical protein
MHIAKISGIRSDFHFCDGSALLSDARVAWPLWESIRAEELDRLFSGVEGEFEMRQCKKRFGRRLTPINADKTKTAYSYMAGPMGSVAVGLVNAKCWFPGCKPAGTRSE